MILIRLAILCVVFLCFVQWDADAAPKGSKWRIGTPIVTYFPGPSYRDDNPLNDITASQLVAGGFTVGWAGDRKDLDTLYRHGLRALYYLGLPDPATPEGLKELDTRIGVARNHPAMYAYRLGDEPNAGVFPLIGRTVQHLKQHDPASVAWINLLPMGAPISAYVDVTAPDQHIVPGQATGPQDGKDHIVDAVTAYREYLRKLIASGAGIISYDYYPFGYRKDGTKGDGLTYFLNLMLVREAALKADVPFMQISQAISHECLSYRWPTEHEMRWQAYTTLAYGGQGICWYIYNSSCTGIWTIPGYENNKGESGFFKDPPSYETPLPRFWTTASINREFVAIATELQKQKSLAAYHVGPHLKYGDPDDDRWKTKIPVNDGSEQFWEDMKGDYPIGGVELPASCIFQLEPQPKSANFLLGVFGNKNRPSHVLVVNLDYENPQTTTLKGPKSMDVFHAPTRTWSRSTAGSEVKLDLPPGGGVLVRLR